MGTVSRKNVCRVGVKVEVRTAEVKGHRDPILIKIG